jgi:WhiB family redox-sensing transcriptional regulator
MSVSEAIDSYVGEVLRPTIDIHTVGYEYLCREDQIIQLRAESSELLEVLAAANGPVSLVELSQADGSSELEDELWILEYDIGTLFKEPVELLLREYGDDITCQLNPDIKFIPSSFEEFKLVQAIYEQQQRRSTPEVVYLPLPEQPSAPKISKKFLLQMIGTSASTVISQADLHSHWQRYARCNGIDPDLFFPERGEDSSFAKAVCKSCPVQETCLEFALLSGQKFGIWGGLSERQRRVIRKQRGLVDVEVSTDD